MSEPIDTSMNVQVGNGEDGLRLPNLQVDSGLGTEGKPYATVDGQDFATAEDLTKWYDSRNNSTETGTQEGQSTVAGTEGGDTLEGSEGNDSVAGGRSDDEIKASLKEAGGIYADPKYEPFALEFEKTGALSEASIKGAAEAFGIPEDFVKEFIVGQQAVRANATSQVNAADVAFTQELVAVVPEAKDYQAIMDWGKTNLSDAQKAAYDKALGAKDGPTARALLEGFKAKFDASGAGPGPRDVTSEAAAHGTGQGAATGYANREEMHAAQNDDRYRMGPKQDRSFVAEVERKIAASKF